MELKPLVSTLMLMGMMLGIGAVAADKIKPHVLILYKELETSDVELIRLSLSAQLAEVDLETIVVATKAEFDGTTDADWLHAAGVAKRPAGTVAVIGLSCLEPGCDVRILSPQSDAYVKLHVAQPKSDPLKRTEALSAVIREALLGPLLPELERLRRQGIDPTPPPSPADAVLLKSPFESERSKANTTTPWLWISGGYHGDYPHPGKGPLHGPFVGIDAAPVDLVDFGVSVGWLGVSRGAVGEATATVRGIDTTLAIRLMFSLGPARISISALGRLDALFIQKKDDDIGTRRQTRIALQTGGLTMWHLPLPWRDTNAWIGAGVLVSSLNSDPVTVTVDGRSETAVPASTVRMIWCAGIAFNPFR